MSDNTLETRKLQQLEATLDHLLQQQRSLRDQQDAYELQVNEAVRASLGGTVLLKASSDTSAAYDLSHTYEALEQQVSIYREAIGLQTDRLLACQLQPDPEGRTAVEDRGEQYLYNSISATAEASQADTCQEREQNLVPLCKTLICSGDFKEVQGVDQLQWHAMLLSSAGTFEWAAFGTLDDGAESHAQLHALLHGACMALQLNVTHLTMCLDPDLLEEVAEHSKLDTPEDLKDLLKRVDDTLQRFDTVCGRELSGEDEHQLEMVIEGRQYSEIDNRQEDTTVCSSSQGDDVEEVDEEVEDEEAEDEEIEEVEDNSAAGSPDPDQPESSSAGSVEQSALTPKSLFASITEAFTFPICGICMESKFYSSGPHDGCSGTFCNCCTRQHIETQVLGKKWPVICPAVDCGAVLSMADCCKVVYDRAPLRKLAEEADIPDSDKFWWMTCAEAQASRTTDDAGLLALAKEKGWKQCKQCRQMIELEAGCNHITCKCGEQFCYRCGTSYQAGRQQCRCDLFDARAALGPDATVQERILYRRRTFPAYKTRLCWDYNADDPASCPRGVTCNYAHGDEELP
ncbi:hypothetical protein WJX79_004113 [Trebouxia sp. C0005]